LAKVKSTSKMSGKQQPPWNTKDANGKDHGHSNLS
jgi:hypothetical protein